MIILSCIILYFVIGFFAICLIERYELNHNMGAWLDQSSIDMGFIWPVVLWPLCLLGFLISIIPFEFSDILKPIQKLRSKIIGNNKGEL